MTNEDFMNSIDALEKQLQDHEAAADDIRKTLALVRKRLATTTGARAGRNARSGRRRKLAIVDDARAVSE